MLVLVLVLVGAGTGNADGCAVPDTLVPFAEGALVPAGVLASSNAHRGWAESGTANASTSSSTGSSVSCVGGRHRIASLAPGQPSCCCPCSP